jgi:hypothetical protein
VVHKLPPLHEHVGVDVVAGDVRGGHEEGGDQAGAGEVVAVVQLATIPA